MHSSSLSSRAAAIRELNRFYTRQMGVLHERLLDSQFGLTEVRVLFELAQQPAPTTAKTLASELDLDPGYLSRILVRFGKAGLVTQAASPSDRRERMLSLTRRGRRTFYDLDRRATEDIEAMLAKLRASDQMRVVEAARTLGDLLGQEPRSAREPYLLRSHRPGDVGWVVQRHGEIYAGEYGWDEQFEGLVAKIGAQFLERFDPKREASFIAERDGERVGCAFLVRKSKTVAQLRLLLVEPSARGLGIGARLVGECERFARGAGYKKIMLWTQSVLHDARRIYERAGYELASEKPHHSFGHDLVAQIWERKL